MGSQFGGIETKPDPSSGSQFGGIPVDPETPKSITDTLKSQGFLDSAWNAIKGSLSTIGDVFTGEYSRQTAEQIKRYHELQKNGTPEQKREFAKQVVFSNVPFASTVYKATQGNLPGAAGDIAGMLAIPVAAEVATSPTVRAATGGFTERFGQTMAEAPPSPTGKVIGRAVGGYLGKASGYLGKDSALEGILGGGYIGGEVGARLPAVPEATRAGLQGAKLRLQQLRSPAPVGEQFGPPAAPPTPPVAPPLQLPPGPTITPAPPIPPDPSFVRSVPAVYPAGPNPARALPAPANVITPEAPPAPPDASSVRAVPAQYPQVLPETLRANPAAEDLASQLEASMRAETISDYLARNKVPSSMLDTFGPQEWKMVSEQAGVQPPSPENIQAIRSNLAEYEGAGKLSPEAGKMSPAELKADFETKRAVRTKRKGPAVATEPAPAAAPGSSQVPEPWQGTTPPAGAAAPTASAVRVEKLAQHLAESNITLEDLATLPKQPGALLQFDKLARALKQGSPTAAEIPQIIDRVQQLRKAQ